MIYGSLPFLFLSGVGIGLFSALFGVGGGLIMVPLLVLAFERGQHVAEGTSLVVIIPTALAGAYSHLRNGYVDLRLAATMAVGGTVGAVVGATIALGLSADLLRRIFGVFVIVMGLRLIQQGTALWRARSDGADGEP